MIASRRHFLRAAGGVCASVSAQAVSQLGSPFAASLAGVGALAAHRAAAATDSDYKALVCLYMAGGNDSHNWVVPIDLLEYAEYTKARSVLARPRESLVALSSASMQTGGRKFAFASDLAALLNLYEQRQLAVVANVGPLVQPTTKAQFEAGVNLPPKLFSHNDQQSAWLAMAPEGARSGWGGRLGDVILSSNDQAIFTNVSASGNSIFLSGLHATQYQIGASGPVGIGPLQSGSVFGSTTTQAILQRTLFQSGSTPFHADYARVVKRSNDAYRLLASAVANVKPTALSPQPIRLSNGANLVIDQQPIAKQLWAVAQMIGASQALGMRRQVFLVSMDGFDTHSNQLRREPSLMASVAHSVSYFMDTMRTMGMANNVTLFTASDFGRTLTSNGGGSDHGWGSHHFVAGGAVRGGDIFGRFPTTALGSADDVGSGRLLPSTSVTTYAATLARWMGVTGSDLSIVFPDIANFRTNTLGLL